jgi:hypothetical protein
MYFRQLASFFDLHAAIISGVATAASYTVKLLTDQYFLSLLMVRSLSFFQYIELYIGISRSHIIPWPWNGAPMFLHQQDQIHHHSSNTGSAGTDLPIIATASTNRVSPPRAHIHRQNQQLALRESEGFDTL